MIYPDLVEPFRAADEDTRDVLRAALAFYADHLRYLKGWTDVGTPAEKRRADAGDVVIRLLNTVNRAEGVES